MESVPRTSTSQAEGMSCSLIIDMTVQGTMPRILLDGGPALHGGDGEFGGCHPVVDDGAELGHLHQRGFGRVADGDVLLDGGELGLDGVVVVLACFSMRPMTSQRSRVSTVMPERSSSFSE